MTTFERRRGKLEYLLYLGCGSPGSVLQENPLSSSTTSLNSFSPAAFYFSQQATHYIYNVPPTLHGKAKTPFSPPPIVPRKGATSIVPIKMHHSLAFFSLLTNLLILTNAQSPSPTDSASAAAASASILAALPQCAVRLRFSHNPPSFPVLTGPTGGPPPSSLPTTLLMIHLANQVHLVFLS